MEKLQTEHGIFTNNELTGQTARQVYDEWLANKDKPTEPTAEERIVELEQQNSMLMQCVLEMSEIVYA